MPWNARVIRQYTQVGPALAKNWNISSCLRETSTRGSTTDSSFRHPPGGFSAIPIILDPYRHRHHSRRLPPPMPPEWSTSAKLGTAGSLCRDTVRRVRRGKESSPTTATATSIARRRSCLASRTANVLRTAVECTFVFQSHTTRIIASHRRRLCHECRLPPSLLHRTFGGARAGRGACRPRARIAVGHSTCRIATLPRCRRGSVKPLLPSFLPPTLLAEFQWHHPCDTDHLTRGMHDIARCQ